jgi:RND superfamily putative drug exporter
VSVVTNGIALITAVPTTGPNTSATADLVHHLREDRSAIEGSSGTHVLVGGTTATDIDVSAKLRDALPVFVAVVVGLAFILLTFAFRTILVPVTSIIGFLLSVGAAFGAEVAVFQWGWGIIGAKIWHHPRWYDRYIPDPDIEGEKLDQRLTERETVQVTHHERR